MIYPLYYAWKLKALFGPAGSSLYRQRCRIVARGSLNARLVEFVGGERHIVSGNALRRNR